MSDRFHRRRWLGLEYVSVAATGLLVVIAAWSPTPYVLEKPGPAFDTTGQIDGDQVISLNGVKTYPTQTQLDFTTVYVVGGPGANPRIMDTMYSWAAQTDAVVPLEVMYPPTATREQISQSGADAMDSSQDLAVASALEYLNKPYATTLVIREVVEGQPADGVIKPGDIVRSINGEPTSSLEILRQSLQDNTDGTVELTVDRGGQEQELTVDTVELEGRKQLGVYLEREFDFPFDASFALENVGGPSAGMMLSLAVVDELTPGSLAGNTHVAGTGTIDVDGTVGPIGGIRQKMVGATDSGAQLFLAPKDNCQEVVGHVPDSLTVVAVADLEDAVHALEAVERGEGTSGLPTCQDVE